MQSTARDCLEVCAAQLDREVRLTTDAGLDAPVIVTRGTLRQSVGALHVYEFTLPAGCALSIDLPVSIVPGDELEATEGTVLSCQGPVVLLQTVDAIGTSVPSATLIPDRAGHLGTIATRLRDMVSQADAYNLGPSERLVPLLASSEDPAQAALSSSAVLTTVWLEEQTALHGSEVASFVTACNLLARGQTEEAVLGGSLEPYFSLTLAPGEKRGRF